MGYRTDFKVDEGTSDNILERIIEISGYNGWDGNYLHGAKWYEWKEHMLQVSLEFPEVLLKLEGIGEETGDMWHAYFKRGRCQYCRGKVVYPPFDESKLK